MRGAGGFSHQARLKLWASCKGTDKFAENQLQTFAAKHIAAPLLAGCVAWLECKINPEPHNQNTYDLFIAEVVAAYADERVFSDGIVLMDMMRCAPFTTLQVCAFFATGATIQSSI